MAVPFPRPFRGGGAAVQIDVTAVARNGTNNEIVRYIEMCTN